MKDIYQLRNKALLFFSGLTSVLLVSCGSYQAATYDDDGIYSSETPETKTVVVIEKTNAENSKYYEEYFGRTVTDYGEIVEDEVFTDVDSYSSQDVVEQDTEVARESYSAWEDAGDNVTINVYNTRPYYSYYRPYNYWNNYYYNDWAFGGFSWGWGSHYHNYGYYGYNYGYPYYYNSPYYYNNYGYYGPRNYGYVNGPRRRGYASNYYSGRHSNRRSTLRSSGVTPRRTSRATTPRRSTPRATTPRSTPRPRATTPRSTTPRSTPRPRPSTPRSVTPRSTPRPRATTPRSTPRATAPRRSAPRSAPRSSSRSSSSRRGGRA